MIQKINYLLIRVLIVVPISQLFSTMKYGPFQNASNQDPMQVFTPNPHKYINQTPII